MDLETCARLFATKAHSKQFRKDSKTPYIAHPAAVVEILKSVNVTNANIIAAAWLHDVVEDCGISLEAIKTEFNLRVACYVGQLSCAEGDDKELYAQQIVYCSARGAQLIKLADFLHNCETMRSIKDKIERSKTTQRYRTFWEKYYSLLARRLSSTLYRRISNAVSKM